MVVVVPAIEPDQWSWKTLVLGTVHTVWTGIGAVGAFVGLGEPLTIGRVLAAALLVAGLSLMKMSTSAWRSEP